MSRFYPKAQALYDQLVTHRRDFHAHPELGFQEFRTAGIVAQELTKLGLEVQTGVGKTGVVGLMGGNLPGATVLLRFDMDALPIVEETGVAFQSQNAGVMHACGHDAHTSMGLALAKMFSEYRDTIKGTLKFVFQPAEEAIGGAAEMVKDGVLSDPAPDYCFGMHVWNSKPLGWVAATPGAVMAAADSWHVTVYGKGGHAAAPEETLDPVVASAQIVSALQTLVSRNVSGTDTAVVSVTAITSGNTTNVIPEVAYLKGTIRTFKQETRTKLKKRFQEVVLGVGNALGCRVEVAFLDSCDAVVNDASLASEIRALASQIPTVNLVDDSERVMGSEDYSEFQRGGARSCYFFVGSAKHNETAYGHHHPKFDIDEQSMVIGASLMADTVARIVLP
jgi:amidohydrolase